MNRGGGVLIAVSNKFSTGTVKIYQTKHVDSLWLEVTIMNNKWWVGVIYISPKSPVAEYSSLFDYATALINVACQPLHNILIAGDFNCSDYFLGNDSRSVIEIKHFAQFLNLKQFNSVANVNGRILDLIFSTLDTTITPSLEPLVPLDKYHPALAIEIMLKNIRIKSIVNTVSTVKKYLFNKGNYELLYHLVKNSDFSEIIINNNPDSCIKNFYQIMHNCMEQAIPLVNITFDSRFPIWFNKKIKNLLKIKNSLLRKLKRKRVDAGLTARFKVARSNLKKEIKLNRKAFTDKAESDIQKNPRNLWNFVKSLKNSPLNNSIIFNDLLYTSPQDIANNFASQFSKTYSKTKCDFKLSSHINNSPLVLSCQFITEAEVSIALKMLKGSRCCGSDLLPSFILKGCGENLVEPLCHIFNICLKNGYYPQKWKESRVCPVHKKGPKNEGANYRPISLLCAVSKVFEIIIYKRLYNIVSPSIIPEQHGFVKQRSTISNLISFTNHVSKNIQDKKSTHVIYFDFSKAFDTVDHCLLLKKLQNFFDIPAYLLYILSSYLTNRLQYVSFNHFNSYSFPVPSGVPQGSHLGPLLFVLFINDICKVVESCRFSLYADDLKLYRTVSTQVDSTCLQSDINNIVLWSKSNYINLNTSKCQLMVYCYSGKCPLNLSYVVDGLILSPAESISDLGVLFDSKLTFKNHIFSMVSKAQKHLGMTLRACSHFKNTSTFNALYFAYVRSVIEYASVVWNCNGAVGLTNMIEKVQNRFLRYLYFKAHNQYPHYMHCPIKSADLRKEFNLTELSVRRTISDQLFLYKLLYGKIDDIGTLSEITLHVPPRATRSKVVFQLPLIKQNTRAVSPLIRIMRSHNIINSNFAAVDIFCITTNNFKKILHESLP